LIQIKCWFLNSGGTPQITITFTRIVAIFPSLVGTDR
jgi:hypothetical protein